MDDSSLSTLFQWPKYREPFGSGRLNWFIEDSLVGGTSRNQGEKSLAIASYFTVSVEWSMEDMARQKNQCNSEQMNLIEPIGSVERGKKCICIYIYRERKR